MSYLRAEEILPKEVLELVQQYVSGKAIYVPCREKQPWGEKTETKALLSRRNQEIFRKFQEGISTKALAAEYFLTEKSIQRIIRKLASSDPSAEVSDGQ